MDKSLPFEVGQVVEARSFQRGYRGAWFNCKIKQISRKKGHLHYALEYLDFPDEKLKWTKVFQVPVTHTATKSRDVKRELMVRPCYPPTYHQNNLPKTVSKLSVVVNHVWKVGDLIDCWIDGCYWSANLSKMLPANKAQVDLIPIPVGEGLSYTVQLKDVRPSLEWSPQHGWTLPVSQDGENNRCCGRLFHPEGGVSDSSTVHDNDGELSKKLSDSEFVIANANGETLETSFKLNCAKETSIAKEALGSRQMTIHLVEENTDIGKRKRSVSNSCDVTNDASDEEHAAPRREILDQEAAVLHLVELTSKVKWLKGILQSDSSFSTADDLNPNWKIIENRAAPSSR